MTRLSIISVTLLVALAGSAQPSVVCSTFVDPAAGPIIAGFAPHGRYAGHWGIDYATSPDSRIVAAFDGRVTWSGQVVENLSVTLDHGGGLRTSYSYLSRALVSVGDWVAAGQIVGMGSSDHLHFSVRVGGSYIDPMIVLGCIGGRLSGGLRLVPVSYPLADATRHPRRYLRSTSRRSSDRR